MARAKKRSSSKWNFAIAKYYVYLIYTMSLDGLAGMFSQRSGVQQSMGNTIISTIIGFLVQKMMGQGLGECFQAEVVVAA